MTVKPSIYPRVPIGTICELAYGKPLPKEDRSDSGEFVAYGANGVKCRTDKYLADKPTLIIGRKGSAGEVTLSEEKFWALDVTYYVIFDEDELVLQYLFYVFQTLGLPSYAKGVKPGLNRNDVYGIEIPLPPLPEQKKIVAILDEAFAGIAQAIENTERSLALAHELIQANLDNEFSNTKGWEERNLGEIGECKNSRKDAGDVVTERWSKRTLSDICAINPKKGEVKTILGENELVSFIPMDCVSVNTQRVQVKEDRTLSSVYKGYTYFKENDVLLAKITPCFENGKLGIASGLTNGVGFGSSEYFVFRASQEIDPVYLYYFLSRESFRQKAAKNMTGAVGHKRVPKHLIENLQIPLPPLPEQKKIVGKFEEVTNQSSYLAASLQGKLLLLQTLRKSLLKKAFSGELATDTIY